MTDPVISPDGKWMWTGSEWIPAPPAAEPVSVSMQDSVIAGDVNITQNNAEDIAAARETNMKTELRFGEQVVKEGAANLQKNIETVGGKLYLTSQRLVFEAHKINFQGGTTEIELSNIQSSRACSTKFLGFIPLFPNSLAVFTKQGQEYRFVLFGRHKWAAEIKSSCLAVEYTAN